MLKSVPVLLAALTIFAIACGGPSVSVNYDYDTEYDFSNMKRYAYLPIKATGTVSELKIRRFVDAVNNHLQTQGYTLSTENPDFLVALHSATKDKTSVTDWGYGMGARSSWYGGYRDIDVSQYTEGTIFVDVVDPESRNLVWRGTATSAVDDSASPDKQNEQFAKIAARIFANFPPKQ
jgi:hypothetical protein